MKRMRNIINGKGRENSERARERERERGGMNAYSKVRKRKIYIIWNKERDGQSQVHNVSCIPMHSAHLT